MIGPKLPDHVHAHAHAELRLFDLRGASCSVSCCKKTAIRGESEETKATDKYIVRYDEKANRFVAVPAPRLYRTEHEKQEDDKVWDVFAGCLKRTYSLNEDEVKRRLDHKKKEMLSKKRYAEIVNWANTLPPTNTLPNFESYGRSVETQARDSSQSTEGTPPGIRRVHSSIEAEPGIPTLGTMLAAVVNGVLGTGGDSSDSVQSPLAPKRKGSDESSP